MINKAAFKYNAKNYFLIMLSCNVFGAEPFTMDSEIPSATVDAIFSETSGLARFKKHDIIIISGKDLKTTSIGTPYTEHNLNILKEKIGSESLAELTNQIIERILWCGEDIQEIFLMCHLDESQFFAEGRSLATVKDHAHKSDMYILTLTHNEKITTIISDLRKHIPKNQLVFMPKGTLHRTPKAPKIGSNMRIHLNVRIASSKDSV